MRKMTRDELLKFWSDYNKSTEKRPMTVEEVVNFLWEAEIALNEVMPYVSRCNAAADALQKQQREINTTEIEAADSRKNIIIYGIITVAAVIGIIATTAIIHFACIFAALGAGALTFFRLSHSFAT